LLVYNGNVLKLHDPKEIKDIWMGFFSSLLLEGCKSNSPMVLKKVWGNLANNEQFFSRFETYVNALKS
jgi:hypothetical protein